MIRIFIESGVQQSSKKGKGTTNEQNFVEEFIAYHFPSKQKGKDYEVIGIGGKDQLANSLLPFDENTLAGGTNILLFDADTVQNLGGYAARSTELMMKREQLGLDFELFLWPNNQDDGDFESLLIQMINPVHQCLLDCFNGFEMCIRGNDPDEQFYKTPERKSAIYTYINSFIKSKSEEEKMKSGYWFFNDARFWNLDADAGKPFVEFLSPILESSH